MLQALVGYVEDLGITIRWLVIHGDADFFSITKRLHNAIHGHGDVTTLGQAESHHYGRILAANAVGLLERVLLADPTDLTAFGVAVRDLLGDAQERSRLGAAAHSCVRDNFVGDLHLLRYADVFATLMRSPPRALRAPGK